MRDMLRLLAERLGKGQDAVMVTVVASSGSAPRGAGSRMLVTREGRLCGTIGGGAVEYRSEQIAAQVLEDKSSKQHDFTLTKDDVQQLGMICGGAVSVYFCYISAEDDSAKELCKAAEELFVSGSDFWLIYEIGGGMAIYSEKCGYVGGAEGAREKAQMLRYPVRVKEGDIELYSEQIGHSGRVFVFGCGHVAQELVPVLMRVGFKCVALDDREEFAKRELFPIDCDVMLVDFEKLADYIEIKAEDYVCVMTRGHAFDAVVQAQVLKTKASYIGVIGSKAKRQGVFEWLYERGFTTADTDRIKTPIGMYIKAETPAEIAISIAAEMIEFRANKKSENGV